MFSIGSASEVKISQVTPPILQGEGPHWDTENGLLYYASTFTGEVLCWNPVTNKVATHKLEGRSSAGIIIPIRDKKGEFVVAADRYLYKFSWDCETDNTGVIHHTQIIEEEKEKNQFNDGKADINGNLWIGTLTRQPDLTVEPEGGCLYRVVPKLDGEAVKFDLEEKIKSTSISNGIAFSKDNKTLFWVDSALFKVFAYDFDLESGKISDESRVIFDLKSNGFEGIPDGLTIDTNDDLWVAMHGAKSIVQVDSKTCEIKRVIDMPATYVTSVCFGGENLDVLFATTSKLLLDDEGKKNEPLAGSVFSITGLGVKGYPPYDVVVR